MNEMDDCPTDAAGLCARFRRSMDDLIRAHPELALVQEEFDEVVRHDSDPLRELSSLLDACREVFLELRQLINPIGMPLHITPDGRVRTDTVENVAAFVTDIRGFTELTNNVRAWWGVDVFELLSFCYFPHVVEVLGRYGCRYLNYTGDGLIALSQPRLDDAGKVVLPGLDNAVLCAMEMTAVTNCIAETWKRLGLVQSNGQWHETGLGLTSGSVQVGDPFVPDRTPTGKLAEFDGLFRSLCPEMAPSFPPRIDFDRRIMGIHALSPVINCASRLQDTDKAAPNHTCMTTAMDLEKLCPALRARFESVGTTHMKGLGHFEVFGFLRFEAVDVPALERECLAWYASAAT